MTTVAAAPTERQLKDRAHALLAKGSLDPALEVFKQLICMNGKEPAYRLRHAEVSARLGRAKVAVGSYRVAAHLLGEAGRTAQARAVLHRAMELDPKDLTLRRMAAAFVDAAQRESPTRPAPVFLGRDELPTEPCLLPMFD